MAARSTLAESVAAALRHAILHGAYSCGERLVELTIAREMNVSQNTVRDALRLLEQDGLVVKRARYGTHIRTFSPEEITETYALWAAIEGLALRWALAHLTPDRIARLRELLKSTAGSRFSRKPLSIPRGAGRDGGRPQTADLLNHLHNRARLLEKISTGTHAVGTCRSGRHVRSSAGCDHRSRSLASPKAAAGFAGSRGSRHGRVDYRTGGNEKLSRDIPHVIPGDGRKLLNVADVWQSFSGGSAGQLFSVGSALDFRNWFQPACRLHVAAGELLCADVLQHAHEYARKSANSADLIQCARS